VETFWCEAFDSVWRPSAASRLASSALIWPAGPSRRREFRSIGAVSPHRARGIERATIAVGHAILVIAFHLLSRKTTDLGPDYFGRRTPAPSADHSSNDSRNSVTR
jgi:hypothetical protein